jgi:hypothetical protein
VGPNYYASNLIQVKTNSNEFKFIQIHPNSACSKQDIPGVEQFEIKYGFKGFAAGNNFGVDFE